MVTLQNLIEYDSTILDNITLPDGLDSDCMKSVIMMRLGLCWPIYDEPEVFSNMVYTWFITHYWNIERLVKVTGVDYSPLENYDRQESYTDTSSGSTNTSDNNTNTINRTDTIENETSGSGSSNTDTDSTTENTVSAYNSESYDNDNKSESDGSSKTTTSSEGSLDETRKYTGTTKDARDISTTNNAANTRNGRAHGNIGVTTSQQMFNAEVNLLSGYNIYYEICNWFERDMFIQVY